MRKIVLSAVAVLSAAALISGCGGGGEATPEKIDAAPAEPTIQNGVKVVALLNDAHPTDEFVDLLLEMIETIGVGETFENIHAPCDSGSVVGSGEITPTTAEFTFDFDHCYDGAERMDGRVYMTGRGNMAALTLSSMSFEFSTTFTALLEGTEYVITAGGMLNADFTAFSDTNISGTQSSSLRWSAAGETSGFDDLTVNVDMNPSIDRSEECYTEGTLYINNMSEKFAIDESYDVNCADPIVMESDSVISGSMRLIGAGGGIVDLNVTAPDEITVTDANGSTVMTF